MVCIAQVQVQMLFLTNTRELDFVPFRFIRFNFAKIAKTDSGLYIPNDVIQSINQSINHHPQVKYRHRRLLP
jgi:hypothetical protein